MWVWRDFLADRELLHRGRARNPLWPNVGSQRLVPRLSMSPLLNPSFVALLRQGGVGGANRRDRRLWRSARFAPMPPGTDTARPAAHF